MMIARVLAPGPSQRHDSRMRITLPLVLLLGACFGGGPQQPRQEQEPQPQRPGPQVSREQDLIAVQADYDPRLFEGLVALSLHNRTDELVCLESGDLRPGGGSTFVGDARGEVLNGSGNPALAFYRDVNLASPLVVIRPRREYLHFVELGELAGQARQLQVGIRAFKCSELFGPGAAEPNFNYVVHSYRLEDHQAIPAEPFVRDEPPPPDNPG